MYQSIPPSSNGTRAPFPRRTAWWKVAGSTSAIGVLAGSVHAETVQITLIDNQISHDLGNTIDSDLTGDGIEDLMSTSVLTQTRSSNQRAQLIAATLNSGMITAAGFRSTDSYQAFIAPSFFTVGSTPRDISDLVPIVFTDARINGGAQTNGLLEIRARNVARTNDQVSLVRLVFDDASTEEPTDAVVGDTKPSWVYTPDAPDASVLRLAKIAKVKRKVKSIQRKLRKVKRTGNRVRILRVREKLGKLKAKLQELRSAE